jgi:hypothetical protein
MKEFGLIGIIFFRVSHRHRHHTCANRALNQPLTFVFLRLGLLYRQHIITKFAIEILDFFLETESAEPFLALDAAVHFFFNELSVAPTLVVNIWRSKLGQSIHIDYWFINIIFI